MGSRQFFFIISIEILRSFVEKITHIIRKFIKIYIWDIIMVIGSEGTI